MIKLTQRQQEILDLIEKHIHATGSPPTRAEIAKRMGFRSPNAAEDHLKALAKKGVIELVPSTSRGIRLTKSLGIPIIPFNSHQSNLLSEDNMTGTCRLDKNFFKPEINFMLHITQSDFQSLGILSGDYVAFCKTTKIKNGQLVLLKLNNEFTIRRFSEEMDRQYPNIEGILVGVIRSLTSSIIP